MDLQVNERAARKLLITVAEWREGPGTSSPLKRQILGARTPDSSIELNVDSETSTDILGINYTDVNKTQPQQSFDPHFIMGTEFDEYLSKAVLENDITAFNNAFDIYVIAAFMHVGTATTSDGKYYTVKHANCSIIPQSIGGESYVGLPFDVYFSNDITVGTVDKLDDEFTFTPAAS